MRLVALAFSSLLLVTPALAADSSVSLAAKLFGGLADGASIEVNGIGRGPVKATGDGLFEAALDKGTIGYAFVETDHCKFTFESRFEGSSGGGRADFTKLHSIKIRDYGDNSGLNSLETDFFGPEDMVQMIGADGTTTNAKPAVSWVTTSLTAADLQSAADAMLALCGENAAD